CGWPRRARCASCRGEPWLHRCPAHGHAASERDQTWSVWPHCRWQNVAAELPVRLVGLGYRADDGLHVGAILLLGLQEGLVVLGHLGLVLAFDCRQRVLLVLCGRYGGGLVGGAGREGGPPGGTARAGLRGGARAV